jgi:pyruvate formate lyase activating enzyme
MRIGGLQKFTLTDFPGKVACIVFTVGCNFRCPYCHNKELVTGDIKEMPEEEFFQFLNKRKGKLDGVVITGGEPTIHQDLPGFIQKIKEHGFSVKLDTNGSNPEMLEKLVDEGLVDYVAMDVKAPLEDYDKLCDDDPDIEKFRRSIEIVKGMDDYEFRTTAAPGIIDREGMQKIGETVKDAKNFYIQQFEPENTLNESYSSIEAFTEEQLEEFKKIIEGFVEKGEIKNI